MRVVRNLSFFSSPEWRALVGNSPVGVTIGNFDGIHLGHQALFDRLAAELPAGGKKILLTFAPHPRRVLSTLDKFALDRDSNYCALTSIRQKCELANARQFDAMFLVRFTKAFARMEPSDFVRQYLRDSLNASLVVVGHDWCFGKDRSGTPERLSELGQQLGFRVIIVPPLELAGERVGSRLVKQAVEAGDMAVAQRYLGRYFSLSGRVRHGDQRGRTIGFPTANLEFVGRCLPANGVYACYATVDGGRYEAVTNVGIRPTFSPARQVVEVHLFADGFLDLYGKALTVEFVHRLRAEKKFSGVAELRGAIANDIAQARTLFTPNLTGNPGNKP